MRLCNRGIGLLGDDVDRVRAAYMYLSEAASKDRRVEWNSS
jgi:hypothetical protein